MIVQITHGQYEGATAKVIKKHRLEFEVLPNDKPNGWPFPRQTVRIAKAHCKEIEHEAAPF